MSALIQMRERFLKNQMNGQFFEKMKWKQFLYIFSHGLRGKYNVNIVSTGRYHGNIYHKNHKLSYELLNLI
jgi:hypothetical protein